MDLSFSIKPNVLIPSGSYINFHLRRLPRKEFLGCGIQIRSPVPEFRTARRIPEQTHPTRCVVLHDSLYDGSIIAIAASVAVFAAMDFVYTNRSSGRNVGSDFDVEGTKPKISVTLACVQLTKDTDNSQKDCIGKHVLANKSRCTVPAVFDERNLTSTSPVLLSSVKDQTFIGKDGEFLSPRTNVLSKVDALKDQLNVGQLESTEKRRHILDNSDFMSEKQEKTLLDNVYSLKAFHISNFFVIPVHCKQRDFCPSQHYGTLQHTDDKRELPDLNYNGDHCRFTKEAYGCNEELDVKALSCFNSLNEKPLNLIIQRNGGCYDDFKQSMRKAEVPEKRGKSVLSERQDLFMCIQKAFRSNDKETSKRQLSTKEIDKNLMWKRENKYSSVFLQPLGRLVEDSSNLETCLITYERLLRDVRLKDCVDLLERMERKGLLDMDKIHHTRFLTACKRQKAVKEAFRFFKMINKPKLSTFNMLLSVCANSQDFDGAFEVMLLIKEARLKPDCKLYTTLISACGKCEKVDAMFEVFHEMLSSGIDANANTYGALIDGCARVGQVAKAFGAYGIMRSKNVQPDRVVFNALITACGRSGALDRAFDVLAEMKAEPKPIEPDHITIGALLKACIQAGQTHRAREVYKMLQLYNIKGTPDVYTIAVNSCSQTGDLNFALMIYDDMKRNGVEPDEMFLSTIIDAAGHAQNVDTAFSILKDARSRGVHIGSMTYSSLMGACCNAKNWKKALTLYEEIKTIKLLPTVSTLNALVTALCDGDQLPKSVEVLDEMKRAGVLPTVVTYSILIVACEKKDEAELGFALLSKAKDDGILPNLIMCRCLTGLCLRAYAKACSLGEPIVSFNSGRPQIDSIWTSRAIMVYRETISSGEIPTIEVFSQVLGCLRFPRDSLLRSSFIENLGVTFDASRCSNISSFLHGFGEYDSRSFSVLEEAASLRVVPRVSLKENPIVLDARKLLIHTVEVYILTILKGLKYRLAAGARLPCMIILMPRGKTVIGSPNRERTVYIATRVGQVVGSLLRRLGLPYQGDESRGRIRINGLALRRWFRPKLSSFSSMIGRPGDMIPPSVRLAKGIAYQQRSIRSSDLSVDLD